MGMGSGSSCVLRAALSTLTLGCLGLATWAGPTVIPVAEDITVNQANPDSNLNTITTRGGLLSGLDGTGSDYRFYLKFNLPSTPITNATLVGFYTDKLGGPNSFHGLYFIADDTWTESTMTFSNAPPLGGLSPNGGFEAATAMTETMQYFDITSLARQEQQGDRVLSLAFQTIDGRFEDLE